METIRDEEMMNEIYETFTKDESVLPRWMVEDDMVRQKRFEVFCKLLITAKIYPKFEIDYVELQIWEASKQSQQPIHIKDITFETFYQSL